jgi:hypothetical protein
MASRSLTRAELRDQLAGYLEDQAAWREAKAEEYPGDARNHRSPAGLYELAAEVRGLPEDDPLLTTLENLHHATSGLDVYALMPADEATAGVSASKFRFHDPGEPGREFLARLIGGTEEEIVDVHMSELAKHIDVDDELDG